MITTSIEFKGKVITLSAVYEGTATPWGGKYVKDEYTVTVEYDGKSFSFKYYCNSNADERLMIDALNCLVMDAIDYDSNRDIDDFFDAYGYDSVKECLKAYNGCKDAWDKCEEVGIDARELNEYLEGNYGC